MGGIFLKNKEKQQYVKSINTQEATMEFTNDPHEAKNYANNGEWFADTELEWLQFHMKKQYGDIVNDMVRVYEQY